MSLRNVLIGLLCAGFSHSLSLAQESPRSITYSTFSIPAAANGLSATSIDDSGTVSGSYLDANSDTVSFVRTSGGTITSYTEPADTSSPTFTSGGQINRTGAVAGQFFDTADNAYIGYIYKSASGTFSTYQVPGEPAGTTTGLSGLNDDGNLCGFVWPPPYTLASAFVEITGSVTQFTVGGSATTACETINDSRTAAGYYLDSSGVYHGWTRTSGGTVTTIDFPGASSIPGTAPCVTGPTAGTVVIGINNKGYVSGHYWDTSYNEHGFLMTPAGKFAKLNVPGAYQTSGGSLNDYVQVVGHYTDSSCKASGYIATP